MTRKKDKLSRTMQEIFRGFDRAEVQDWGAVYHVKPDPTLVRSRILRSTLLGAAVVVSGALISILVAFIPLLVAVGS